MFERFVDHATCTRFYVDGACLSKTLQLCLQVVQCVLTSSKFSFCTQSQAEFEGEVS